jgi:hypothetical protein
MIQDEQPAFPVAVCEEATAQKRRAPPSSGYTQDLYKNYR